MGIFSKIMSIIMIKMLAAGCILCVLNMTLLGIIALSLVLAAAIVMVIGVMKGWDEKESNKNIQMGVRSYQNGKDQFGDGGTFSTSPIRNTPKPPTRSGQKENSIPGRK